MVIPFNFIMLYVRNGLYIHQERGQWYPMLCKWGKAFPKAFTRKGRS